MNNEYITVAEYAKIKNISVQSVYKQLNKGLKPWFKVVDGKKCLLSTVLTEDIKPHSTKVDKPLNQPSTEVLNQSLIDTLNKTIELLQEQLKTKDNQIEELNRRLEQALNNNSQSNYIAAAAVADTKIAELPQSNEETTKKGFFKKIFKKQFSVRFIGHIPQYNIDITKGNKPQIRKEVLYYGKEEQGSNKGCRHQQRIC